MSNVRFIYSTSGEYVAFVTGGYLFSPGSEFLGIVTDKNEVYRADGTFLGYLLEDDRIVRRKGEQRPRIARMQKPLRPLRPLPPLRRLRMPRLPHPYEDMFESAAMRPATIPSVRGAGYQHLEGAKIFASDGMYLGRITRNRYDQDSITNPYGPYGSQYSATSIHNKYGRYGSQYSPLSPYNQYSTTPPTVVMNERFLGYLTKNKYLQSPIDPEELNMWLSAA